ncbi:uncharacterized protein LOC113235752 [Hyposmocoma kahamanoa]|uniref:uncharacterized protein LOC113235752 n=1 Tax=Hyposmocoma kahamanoa TaxID=1477025 RepID=UPI000E6D8952|nr:uncharacterized protein LOC113235752 [Hyposmocoma kahamanoa]
MCYICNCFGWALDFLQRILTFCLGCILSGVIMLALIIAIAAGVAYGYNYSMAEYLTFTRQDTTVYMRRGQFYDKPDVDLDAGVPRHSRRMGPEIADTDGDSNTYNPNGIDFKAAEPEQKAFHDTWTQVKDTRKYANVLTRYDKIAEESMRSQAEVGRAMEPRSKVTQMGQDTTTQESLNIMGETLSMYQTYVTEELLGANLEFQGSTVSAIRLKTQTTELLPRLINVLSPAPDKESFAHDYSDDIDEDNVVYKPV